MPNSIPTLNQWVNDSRGSANKSRNSDEILSRIDQLVEAHETADSQVRQLVRVDLFWCLDYWLKTFKSNPSMDASREASVQSLYVTVVNALCANFNCQVNTLVNKLEEAFGRTIGSHGLQVDLGKGLVKYFSDTERKLYQLQFRGGLAFQRPWWEPNGDLSALVPVESSRASDPTAFFGTGASRVGFAGFVMSMGRDFYMAKHGGPNEKNSRIFHSSYLGENMVSCAGTMLVQAGQIRIISPDSGHFRPGDVNVMMMLRALQMLGVRLDQIIIQDFLGNVMGTANVIVRQQTWNSVLQHMQENLTTLQVNQNLARMYKNPAPAPHRPPSNPPNASGYRRIANATPNGGFYTSNSNAQSNPAPPQTVQNLMQAAQVANGFYQ